MLQRTSFGCCVFWLISGQIRQFCVGLWLKNGHISATTHQNPRCHWPPPLQHKHSSSSNWLTVVASAFSFSYTSDSNTHVAFPPDNYSLMMSTTILCQQPFRHLFLHLVPKNIRKHRSPESGARRDAWNVSSLFLFLALLLWKRWKVSTLDTPERQRTLESDQQKVHFRYAKVFFPRRFFLRFSPVEDEKLTVSSRNSVEVLSDCFFHCTFDLNRPKKVIIHYFWVCWNENPQDQSLHDSVWYI